MVAFDEVLADLEAAGVSLRRAWPRNSGQLLLDLDGEYGDGEAYGGRESSSTRIAGQWFADTKVATEVATATAGARQRGRVVLQPAGADRRLTGLPALLQQPGSRLVAHRPERRAVVALEGGARFAKLVPRRRMGGLRHAAYRASQLPVPTPRVLPDQVEDALVTEALPGTPLPELLRGPRADEALHAVGAALARLHRCPAPAGSTVHGPQDEVAVTTRWEDWARAYGCPISVAEEPVPSAAPDLRVIHRDLHDGQILLTAGPDEHFHPAGVGLLDFDLMAAGDPALDLANLIEHLLLRERQGVLADAGSAVGALLDGYDPDQDVFGRAIRYRALTARRLVALYGFRSLNLAT